MAAVYSFTKVTLPSTAKALNMIKVDSFDETYPLHKISVHYYDETSTFQIRITNKRVVTFRREDVIVPTSIDDADLKAKLDDMVVASPIC